MSLNSSLEIEDQEKVRWLIIIPAWNEEASLPNTIKYLREAGFHDLVVINDGSRDRTAEVSQGSGARVLSLIHNLGIGAAMQTGFKYACDAGFNGVVQCDADGQHPADEIRALCQQVEEGQCDVAIGSRFLGRGNYKQTISRRIGGLWFEWLLKKMIKQSLSDPTSGFRALGPRALRSVQKRYPADYPEVEVLVQYSREGLRVQEVPVSMKRREQGTSSIKTFSSFYYMVKVSLALILGCQGTQDFREGS